MTSQERRVDQALARAIDRAIFLEHMEGTLRAWSYLTQLGLSPNARRRVLLLHVDAQRRRRAAVPLGSA